MQELGSQSEEDRMGVGESTRFAGPAVQPALFGRNPTRTSSAAATSLLGSPGPSATPFRTRRDRMRRPALALTVIVAIGIGLLLNLGLALGVGGLLSASSPAMVMDDLPAAGPSESPPSPQIDASPVVAPVVAPVAAPVASNDQYPSVPTKSVDDEPAATERRGVAAAALMRALGLDRIDELTGGLVTTEAADGTLSFGLDLHAPVRTASRLWKAVRSMAAQAGGVIRGEPDVVLRILADQSRDRGGAWEAERVEAVGQAEDRLGKVVPVFGSASTEESKSDRRKDVRGVETARTTSRWSAGAETPLDVGPSAVLLVQGPTASDDSWDALTPALQAAGRRVIVMEERAECSPALARERFVATLATLRELGVRDLDIVARRLDETALVHFLRQEVGNDLPRSALAAGVRIGRVVVIAPCAEFDGVADRSFGGLTEASEGHRPLIRERIVASTKLSGDCALVPRLIEIRRATAARRTFVSPPVDATVERAIRFLQAGNAPDVASASSMRAIGGRSPTVETIVAALASGVEDDQLPITPQSRADDDSHRRP